MGKVLKSIAVIAIAAGIAYFAPGLGVGLLHAFGSTAVAGSLAASVAATVVATGLSLAVAGVMSAITSDPSGERRAPMVWDIATLGWKAATLPEPEPDTLAPIEPRSLRFAFFLPGQRWSVDRLSGNCMNGSDMEGSRWILVDRRAPILAGGFFCFDLDDMWTNYMPEARWNLLLRWRATGMVKRYLGTEPARGRVIFDCTNPPTICETGRARLRYAYAVTAHSPTLRGIVRAWWQARQR